MQTVVYTCTPTGYKAVVQYHRRASSSSHERNQTTHNNDNTLETEKISPDADGVNATVEKSTISADKQQQLSVEGEGSRRTETEKPVRTSSSINPMVAILLRRKPDSLIVRNRFRPTTGRNRPASADASLVQLQHSVPPLSSSSPTTTTTTTSTPDNRPTTESGSPSDRVAAKKKKTTWKF